MKLLHAIALTHQNIGVDRLGDFHIAEENQSARLSVLKNMGVEEFIFLSTCNRVEFLIRTPKELTIEFLHEIFNAVYPNLSSAAQNFAVGNASTFSNIEAVQHWFRVASSLDSLVIGEREILGQIRSAFTLCQKNGFTGDFIRILMRKTVETGKLVYTETEITNNPISVVNLACKKLESVIDVSKSTFVVIGAGKTNTALVKKLKKQGAHQFKVYNRSAEKAKSLAKDCGGEGYALSELGTEKLEYDAILTCTGSEGAIVNSELYQSFTSNTNSPKAIIDLAVPNDIAEEVRLQFPIEYISVEGLKDIANENLKKRRAHLSHCEDIIDKQVIEFAAIHKERQVEIAMRKVPEQIKEIKRKAFEEVFAKDVEQLDNSSKEVLDKVVKYLEKKYMSTPMLLAKEILLKENLR